MRRGMHRRPDHGAISNTYGMGEAAVLAVEAGCDLLLVCHGADNLPRPTPPGGGRWTAAASRRSGWTRACTASSPSSRLRPEQRAGGGAGHRGIE